MDKMWNNPQARAIVQRGFSGAIAALDNYGENIWETVCFLGCGDNDTFTMDQVITITMKENGLARATAHQYVRAFFVYARNSPNEFSGPKSKITRVRRGVYRLDDNPER